jgi:hypothetical protein
MSNETSHEKTRRTQFYIYEMGSKTGELVSRSLYTTPAASCTHSILWREIPEHVLCWGLDSIDVIHFGFDGFNMKVTAARALMGISLLLSSLTGCATHRGGDSDEYFSDQSRQGPSASPTFRPGMNPRDIRDPNSVTRPLAPPAPP